ncbi:MAG: hypothetical protein MI755_14280 [Sphingomonadales bacterium]|nr:hypothetical protein [Sphingomonadales bacterium]
MHTKSEKSIVFGVLGICGAAAMLWGDMLLYFTTEPLERLGTELFGVMGRVDWARLTAGGLLGPLGAVLYLFGYFQIYLTVKEEHKRQAAAVFLLLGTGIIVGGAYHAGFAHIGMMVSTGQEDLAVRVFAEDMAIYYWIVMGTRAVAYLLLSYLILHNMTWYPRWAVLFTPLIWVFFKDLPLALPQPLMIVVAGGWYGWIELLFFAVTVFSARRTRTLSF